MKLRRILALLLVLCLGLLGCGQEQDAPTTHPTDPEESTVQINPGAVTVLFTGGLDNVFAQDRTLGQIGYGALRAYADGLEDEGNQVLLVDGGNSVGGHIDEAEILDIQEAVGYDVRVPGGLEQTLGLEKADYISCTLDLDGYDLFAFEETILGFVGVTAREGLDGQGLCDAVQQAIDNAASAGADYVIVVSNLGTDPEDSPCTAVEVIRNTTGMVAWLECGSGSVLEGETVADKDAFGIPVCAVGAEFAYVGQVTLDLNSGGVTVELVQALEEENSSIKTQAEDLLEAMEATAPTEPEETTEETTEATE